MNKNKVTHLFDNGPLDQDEAIKGLEMLIEELKAGKVIRYCLAAELTDGTIATGWTNANVMQRQVLVSHLQIDIMWKIVQVNLFEE
jgi:hypothetical protein